MNRILNIGAAVSAAAAVATLTWAASTVQTPLRSAGGSPSNVSADIDGGVGKAKTTRRAAENGSYPLSSSTKSIKPWQTVQWPTGLCDTDYHVDGTWSKSGPVSAGQRKTSHKVSSSAAWLWTPNVTVHGDWIGLWSTSASTPNGTGADGRPTYQGVTVTLHNASMVSSHDGSFSWICMPN